MSPAPSFGNRRNLDITNHSIDRCLRRSERGTNLENEEEEIGRVWISSLVKIGIYTAYVMVFFAQGKANDPNACMFTFYEDVMKRMKDAHFSFDDWMGSEILYLRA
jgi:hypothetical protein